MQNYDSIKAYCKTTQGGLSNNLQDVVRIFINLQEALQHCVQPF